MARSPSRALILIGDGLGDRPVPKLKGLTPLEAQPTPNLDQIAAQGECGLMDPIAVGVPAGSDTAHLAILGYDPYKYYTGRGPLEALGVGLEVKPGDVGFRCNFSTVKQGANGSLIIVDRRAGRIKEKKDTHELAKALNSIGDIQGIHFIFRESVEHRGALIMRGEGLDDHLTDADPHEEGLPVSKVKATRPEAEKAARVVNDWIDKAYEVLKDHPVNKARQKRKLLPANICLPRGCGTAPHLPPFKEHNHATGGLVVEVGLIRGLGRFLGMNVIEPPGATGGYDTDHLSMARTAVEALGKAQIVLCNLKAPDLGGHDGNAQLKCEAIGKLDEMAGVLLESLDLKKTVLVVTGDHSTPVSVKDHSGDPVPIIVAGHGVRPDAVRAFGERPCATGNLGRIRGADIMPIITNLMGIAQKFGA